MILINRAPERAASGFRLGSAETDFPTVVALHIPGEKKTHFLRASNSLKVNLLKIISKNIEKNIHNICVTFKNLIIFAALYNKNEGTLNRRFKGIEKMKNGKLKKNF